MEIKIIKANCDKCGKRLFKYNYSYIDGKRIRYLFGLLNVYKFTSGRCTDCDGNCVTDVGGSDGS